MIEIPKLNLFPKTVKMISIPKNLRCRIIFYSENSTFLKSYHLLNIKKIFVKKISFLKNKVPLIFMTPDIIKRYKQLGLLPEKNIDQNKENIFIDVSPFLDLLDQKYGKGLYTRTIILNKIIDYLNLSRSNTTENILIYHVDLSKDLPDQQFLRRSWPLLVMAKAGAGRFPFDYVVVALTLNNKVRYFSIYNKNIKNLQYAKIFNIFKSIKKGKDIEEPKEEQNDKEENKPVQKKESVPIEEFINSYNYDDLRNEDMLGDNKYVSTQDLIKQIKENEQLQESNKTLVNTSNILQKFLKG